jgi:hypothetical protein
VFAVEKRERERERVRRRSRERARARTGEGWEAQCEERKVGRGDKCGR